MPNRNYQSGRRAEWRAQKALARAAQVVVRSAGSKGPVDLVAVYGLTVYLVQVKYVKPGAPWKDANWRKLWRLKVPENVVRLAYVYRRGNTEPEVYHVK